MNDGLHFVGGSVYNPVYRYFLYLQGIFCIVNEVNNKREKININFRAGVTVFIVFVPCLQKLFILAGNCRRGEVNVYERSPDLGEK